MTVGLKSPSKASFLIKHFEKNGLKVEARNSFKVSEKVKVKKKFSLLQLKSFKNQNRVSDHKKMVDEILDCYGSLKNAAQELGENYCTLYSLCQPQEKKIHRKTESKLENANTLKEFFELKSTTTTFPQGRLADKLFMSTTFKESHEQYVKWCSAKSIPSLSQTTFFRLKPENVYKLASMPDNMCICMLCQHFKLDRKCIEEYKILGVGKHTKDIILDSMCPVTDAMPGVLKEYGDYKCISRQCSKCGTSKKKGKNVRSTFYEKKIKAANPGIYSDKRLIRWQRWETTTRISKDGKEIKKLDKVDKVGTRKQFLQVFLNDVHEMALHVFNWKWHDKQFEYIKQNLKPGMLLSVLDFAQNYLNVYPDEPQAAHWDHTQTVIHPIVNFRICPKDGSLITEEHIIISDDLVHDKFAVKAFQEASVNNLISTGFKPSCIIQFCDNCSSQYKSKGPFQYISTSDIPTVRNYFGANHGKGPSDAATGRVKQALTKGRKSRKVELRTPIEVHRFLEEKFKEWEEERVKKCEKKQKCCHFFQKTFYVSNIDRSDEISAVTTNTSSKFSSIRSTGTPLIVEARNVACLCPHCSFFDSSGCPNKTYCGEWQQFDLTTGKKITETVTSHWLNCNLEEQAEEFITVASIMQTDALSSQESAISCNSVTNTNDECNVTNTLSQFNWGSLYDEMQSCVDFASLKELFQCTDIEEIDSNPATLNPEHLLDRRAMRHMPNDAPEGYSPCMIFGDGNCFPRALSVAIGLNDNQYHREMRIRICREGVINKHRYLSHDYLAIGCVNTYNRTTFPVIFSDFSEYRREFRNVAGESNEEKLSRWSKIAEKVYEEEIYMSCKSSEYMGLWQMLQASNVIKRPIVSVYPNRLSVQLRNDLNRTLYPFEEKYRDRSPVYIMWTATVTDGRPNHFVPLLKCMLVFIQEIILYSESITLNIIFVYISVIVENPLKDS